MYIIDSVTYTIDEQSLIYDLFSKVVNKRWSVATF